MTNNTNEKAEELALAIKDLKARYAKSDKEKDEFNKIISNISLFDQYEFGESEYEELAQQGFSDAIIEAKERDYKNGYVNTLYDQTNPVYKETYDNAYDDGYEQGLRVGEQDIVPIVVEDDTEYENGYAKGKSQAEYRNEENEKARDYYNTWIADDCV